jgi:hypothetical protein
VIYKSWSSRVFKAQALVRRFGAEINTESAEESGAEVRVYIWVAMSAHSTANLAFRKPLIDSKNTDRYNVENEHNYST